MCQIMIFHRTITHPAENPSGSEVIMRDRESVLERLTVSAAVRFIPRPPALVLRRNTKISVLQAEQTQRGREGGWGGKKKFSISHTPSGQNEKQTAVRGDNANQRHTGRSNMKAPL